MASKLPNVDDNIRIPENKVPGCLSTVHVDCLVESKEDDNNKLVVNYIGDSDGLLTKGLLALLIRGLSGCTPEEINAVDPQFIQAAKISQTLTPGRNNGFLNMLAVMKKKATEAVDAKVSGTSATSSGEEVTNGDTASEDEDNEDEESAFEEIEGKPMYNIGRCQRNRYLIALPDFNAPWHIGKIGCIDAELVGDGVRVCVSRPPEDYGHSSQGQ